MPEMYIGIKMSDTPSPVPPTNQCLICMQPLVLAKALKCGHFLCLTCTGAHFAANTSKKPAISFKCPVDGSETQTPGIGSKELETKFFGFLHCGNCQKRKNLNKCWWCETCGLVSCSDCGMRHHRSHVCEPWDTLAMVGECYDYLKSINKQLDYRKNFDRLRIDVAAYCEELYQKLTKAIDDQEKSIRAQKSIETTFDQLIDFSKIVDRKETSTLNINKKMALVAQLLEKMFLRRDSKSSPIPILENQICPTVITLPPVDEVFKFIITLSENDKNKDKSKPKMINFSYADADAN